MKMLLITNGDSAAELLHEAGVDAEILPWRDCLHTGPVPQTATDGELTDIRAGYLTGLSTDAKPDIAADMVARDKKIADHAAYDRIELWFEHDLYDQLQIVQIVDMLARAGRTGDLVLVQAPTYLGMQRPDNILRFREISLPLAEAGLATATAVWKAFRDPTPESFAALIREQIAGFPFLPSAIKRMLEELPGADGLTRTQRQILYSIDRGVSRPGPLFARVLAMEEAAFWGDTGFFNELSKLENGENPMIQGLSEPFVPEIMEDGDRRKGFIQSPLELTDEGRSVLSGGDDYAILNTIDYWWGGSHITNQALWRWDAESATLAAPDSAPRTAH